MKVLSVDHITINMNNVEKTIIFYEDIFGFVKNREVDMGDHILYLYQLPGNIQLELIKYKEEQKNWSTNNTDTGIYRHFALSVDNLEECREKCEKAGYGINLYPKYIKEINKTVMLVKDPNGVEIEVIQA